MCPLKLDVLPHQNEYCKFDAKITGLIGGVGSGKTRANVYRFMHLGMKRNGKAKVILVEPTYSMLRDIVRPTFEEVFDKYNIGYEFRASEMIYKTPFGVLLMRSADRPERLKGINATDWIADELDSLPTRKARDVFLELMARIRIGDSPTAAISGTPEGFSFLYELFEKSNIGDKKLIRAKTTDNPFLPKDYIQSLYDNYNEQLVKQYIQGEFVNINQGQVYYAFSRDANIGNYEYDSFYPIIATFDFNVNPMTCCICQYKKDTMYVIDEFYLPNSNTEQMAERVSAKYGNKETDVIICGDASGNSRNTKSSETDYKILINIFSSVFRSVEKRVPKANSKVTDRFNTVNSALNSASGHRLQIDENCEHLIRDLEQVSYNDNGDMVKSNMELTHISDALGYAIMKFMPITRRTVNLNRYADLSNTDSLFGSVSSF